jgi:ParB/RepB/Spo0J family partition protein
LSIRRAAPPKIGREMDELPVDTIKIGQRFRNDLGDIANLAASIERVGMLCPIAVDPNGVLIAGRRRLEAAKLLGWEHVPAVKIDIGRIIEGEAAENFDRKDFNPIEAIAIKRALEPAAKAEAEKRMKAGKPGAKLAQGQIGKARDQVAKFTGIGHTSLDKAAAVLDAAEQEPEAYGELVEYIKKTGKVDPAYRLLNKARDEKRILNLKPVEGKFKTLVVDPPWQYEFSFLGGAAGSYATMTHAELLALDAQFAAWADGDAHLYVWTTNAFMSQTLELMARWGFRQQTILTWNKTALKGKPRFGLGFYFRNSTEHVVFGVRGEPSTRREDIPTGFEAPLGEHREKPEKFYEIVRAASYPPYGEAFQRKARPDFINLWRAESSGTFGDEIAGGRQC